MPVICATFLVLLNATSQSATSWWKLSGDSVRLVSDGQALTLSLRSPVFRFDDSPAVGNTPPDKIEGSLDNGGTLRVSYAPVVLGDNVQLDVRVFLEVRPDDSVLRKWASFHITGGQTRLLKEIALEDIDLKSRKVRTFPGEVQSYPVLLDGFFAGIEFPIATTRVEANHILIAHSPGLRAQPGIEYESRKAVFGSTIPGRELYKYS